MDTLNFNHLYYFYMTAKCGSVSRASDRLMLAASTVSAQIRELEAYFGQRLFERTGRGIKLTEAGRLAYGFAEEIFEIGADLNSSMKQHGTERIKRLRIGMSDALPKLVLPELLDAVYSLQDQFRLICRGDKTDKLANDLTAHEMDLIICDTPITGAGPAPIQNHKLGSSPMRWYARDEYALIMTMGFPQSIHSAPLLLPIAPSPMRLQLDQWLDHLSVQPTIAGEFDDSELIYVLGGAGRGVFAAPAVIESRLMAQYRVKRIGSIEGVAQTYYGVTLDRGKPLESVQRILDEAQNVLTTDKPEIPE